MKYLNNISLVIIMILMTTMPVLAQVSTAIAYNMGGSKITRDITRPIYEDDYSAEEPIEKEDKSSSIIEKLDKRFTGASIMLLHLSKKVDKKEIFVKKESLILSEEAIRDEFSLLNKEEVSGVRYQAMKRKRKNELREVERKVRRTGLVVGLPTGLYLYATDRMESTQPISAKRPALAVSGLGIAGYLLFDSIGTMDIVNPETQEKMVVFRPHFNGSGLGFAVNF